MLMIFLALFDGRIIAQVSGNKGDKLYNKMAYADAIIKYEKMLKNDPDNKDILINLAECYRLTNQNILLEQTFGRLVRLPGNTGQYKYNYALALISNGKYEDAKIWMRQYADATNDERAKNYLKTLETMNVFYSDSSNFKIEKLTINSLNADFSPAIYKDGIVFASSRKQPGLITREHSWTSKPFLTLYYSKGRDGDFRLPEAFASDLKSKFNDGPVSFNKTGDVVFVTRNNIENGKTRKSNDRVVKLKIFEAQNSNGSWRKITNFPYNSDEFNCAHPCVSPDESKLFFASDMPGGFGGMDLYVCIKEGGRWAKPANLGKEINTDGNDIFPYVHADGTLFFASDGHTGMGGLDIYSSKSENNVYTSIKNMGAPINSFDDDFALVFDNTSKTGYFSSNRENRGGDDDIYSFTRNLVLNGIVVEKKDGRFIESATVTLSNSTTGKSEVTTLADGKFSFPIEFGQQYNIYGTKLNMGEDNELLNTVDLSPAAEPFVVLELGLPQPAFTLLVNVIDEMTKEPIEMAVLKLNNSESIIGNTNESGQYKQGVEANSNFKILVSKPGYSSRIISISNEGLLASKDFVFDVELRRANDLSGFEDWNKIIYYDLDKYNIRPKDAIQVLDEVVEFMNSHPEINIKLSSHTDSRASKEYNTLLSKRRAGSAKNYLVNRGVNASRIAEIEWTGESILVNKCGDEVFCTESDHQLNRRTEISIKEIKNSKRKN